MRIGELSKRTGVKIDTLRFYVKKGLLEYTHKSKYWNFDEDQIILVEYIVLLRNLDFSINDIHYLFHTSEDLLDGTKIVKERVIEYREFLENKLSDLKEKKLNINEAELRIEKMLGKISMLEDMEEFIV